MCCLLPTISLMTESIKNSNRNWVVCDVKTPLQCLLHRSTRLLMHLTAQPDKCSRGDYFTSLLVPTRLGHGAEVTPCTVTNSAQVVLLKCFSDVKPFLLSKPSSLCLHLENLLSMSACPKSSSGIHIAKCPHLHLLLPVPVRKVDGGPL